MSQPIVKRVDDPRVAKARAERRRFRRVHVDLPGRLFVPGVSREEGCKVIDLSPGGASVDCEFQPDPNTQVVLYIEAFGRFEGTVVGREGVGFGVRFAGTQLKREKTAEQLTLFLNKTLVDGNVMRRHERTASKGLSQFTRADGSIVKCEVLDLSPGGVSLKTVLRPEVGEFVLVGTLAGRIARHHENGIGIEFVGLGRSKQTADQIHSSIVTAAR
jgi:hypothetical protein